MDDFFKEFFDERYALDDFQKSPYPDFFGLEGIYKIRVIFLFIQVVFTYYQWTISPVEATSIYLT